MLKVFRSSLVLGMLIVGIFSTQHLISQDSGLELINRFEVLEVDFSYGSEDVAKALLHNVIIIASGGEFYLDEGIHIVENGVLHFYGEDIIATLNLPKREGPVYVEVRYKNKTAVTEFLLKEFLPRKSP